MTTNDEHEILIWGPAYEGQKLASGRTLDVPGWVWTCTCGQSGVGYLLEEEAEEWADVHLANFVS